MKHCFNYTDPRGRNGKFDDARSRQTFSFSRQRCQRSPQSIFHTNHITERGGSFRPMASVEVQGLLLNALGECS